MTQIRFPYERDWETLLDAVDTSEVHEDYAAMQTDLLPEGSEYRLTPAQWKAVLYMHPTLQGRRNGRC